MNQLFSTLKSVSKLMAVILLLTAAGCMLLSGVGGFDGGFFPVIGNLVLLVFVLALTAGVAVLLLLQKTDLAKKALAPVFAWWIIQGIISGLGYADFISEYADGLIITVGVFGFLAALTLLAAAVLFVLGMLGKTKLFELGWLLFAVYLCVSFIVTVMACVALGVNDAGWVRVVSTLGDFAMAAGMFFAGLFAWYKPVVKEQDALPAAEEPAAIEEPATEEKPAEVEAETEAETTDETKTAE